MKILLILLLPAFCLAQPSISSFTAAQQVQLKTYSQYWQKMGADSMRRENRDTAAANRKEWLTGDNKLLVGLPIVRKSSLDTLAMADSLFKAQTLALSKLNTAVWTNMNGVSKRLQDNITADSITLMTLRNQVSALQQITSSTYGPDIKAAQQAVIDLQVQIIKLGGLLQVQVDGLAAIKVLMDKVKAAWQ